MQAAFISRGREGRGKGGLADSGYPRLIVVQLEIVLDYVLPGSLLNRVINAQTKL